MDEIREAILWMYRIAKIADKYAKAFEPYETPFNEIYGDAADAIYYLIGEEDPGKFDQSFTYDVLHTTSLTEDRAVALLMNEFKKNHAQPAPNLTTPEEMRKMCMENGGYMTPEGDWK